MSMVVLHRNKLYTGLAQLTGIFGSQIIRVEVMSNDFRFYMEKPFIHGYGVIEMFQCFHILHIADML